MELEKQFTEIQQLINRAKIRAFNAVNKELINLYWEIGKYISNKIANQEWGKGVVKNLSDYLNKTEPGIKGFSSQNLWRMKQFYEAYHTNPKLSPLVREISWTNNMIILSKCKTEEEREFYIRLSIKERLSKRELERHIDSAVFERVILSEEKLSPVVREIHPSANTEEENRKEVEKYVNADFDKFSTEKKKQYIDNYLDGTYDTGGMRLANFKSEIIEKYLDNK